MPRDSSIISPNASSPQGEKTRRESSLFVSEPGVCNTPSSDNAFTLQFSCFFFLSFHRFALSYSPCSCSHSNFSKLELVEALVNVCVCACVRMCVCMHACLCTSLCLRVLVNVCGLKGVCFQFDLFSLSCRQGDTPKRYFFSPDRY